MSRNDAPRLHYLDGLRGAAAFYVVLFHAGAGFTTRPFTGPAKLLRQVMTFGHDAVAVFIVLSGYCLMLPAAQNGGRLSRGFGSYLARRSWRILPPYYVTLLASLALLALLPLLAAPTGTIWDDTSPAFEAGPIGSHLLLIHNLFPAWVYRINGPLWSVATEWQIYFFFPLLLLPVWRQLGALVSVALAFGLGCMPLWLAPRVADRWAPWYLGLFALGMCAAGVGFSERARERELLRKVPWGGVALALLLLCALGVTLGVRIWFLHIPSSDTLVGATTAVALVYLTRHASGQAGTSKPLALRLLESSPLVSLGRCSYSLYLTHLPLVALIYTQLKPLALSPATEMLALIALSVPASLLAAYAFFLICERHFVGAPRLPFRRAKPALARAEDA